MAGGAPNGGVSLRQFPGRARYGVVPSQHQRAPPKPDSGYPRAQNPFRRPRLRHDIIDLRTGVLHVPGRTFVRGVKQQAQIIHAPFPDKPRALPGAFAFSDYMNRAGGKNRIHSRMVRRPLLHGYPAQPVGERALQPFFELRRRRFALDATLFVFFLPGRSFRPVPIRKNEKRCEGRRAGNGTRRNRTATTHDLRRTAR